MKKDTLQLIIDIYYNFNSTCIIDADTLTIDAPEIYEKYPSREKLAAILLEDIKIYTGDIEIC